MKKSVLITLGISILSVIVVSGNPIPTQGTWYPNGPRTPVQAPEPPSAYVKGGEVLICFEDALTDLAVTITCASGSVVFQDAVSGNSGYTLIIPLPSGSYTLTMEHKAYGMLAGEFLVE